MHWLKQQLGSTVTTITAQDAQLKIAAQPAAWVLDVREPEEFKTGHIAGATLIPLGELSERMSAIPREREVLCVCLSGARSLAAARQLSAAGFKVLNLQGGLIAWQRAQLPLKPGAAG